jgi:heme-degrading monooxygenase HmoA
MGEAEGSDNGPATTALDRRDSPSSLVRQRIRSDAMTRDPAWQLAQINFATLLHPLDHPAIQGFVDRLAEINALAERSPGFVWRLMTEEGDATALRPAGPDIIVNMSVWEDIESLRAFTYKTAHVEVLRRRRDWFRPPETAPFALWWIPAGSLPDLDDAARRLQSLDRDGPSAEAFTFKRSFPPPGAEAERSIAP